MAPGDLFDFRLLPTRLRALVWLSGGQVRWRTIQAVLDSGYRDAFRYLHPDRVGYTFPSSNPHVRLDYLFVPESMLSAVTRCDVRQHADLRHASDHLPIFGELRI